MNLPDYISPADVVKRLAEKGIKVSERELRRRAREIGAYRQIGKAMFFLPEDLERIMEPPTPKPSRRGGSKRGDVSTETALQEARRKLRVK